MKARLLSLAALVISMLCAGPMVAAELIMYGEPGCLYCAKWRQTIGPIYAKTAEGKQAPVEERLVSEGRAGGNGLASAIVFSPTFVVMDGGKEIGRFMGYQNDEFFWVALDRLLERLPHHD